MGQIHKPLSGYLDTLREIRVTLIPQRIFRSTRVSNFDCQISFTYQDKHGKMMN
jgi:hypothetical protein